MNRVNFGDLILLWTTCIDDHFIPTNISRRSYPIKKFMTHELGRFKAHNFEVPPL